MSQTTITTTYLGGPTIILEIDRLRFMTDPTLDDIGSNYSVGNVRLHKTHAPFTNDDGKIDYVLLSHEQHPDNLDNKGRAFLSTVSNIFTTPASALVLGGNAVGLEPWQSTEVITQNGLRIIITSTPAQHGPTGCEKLMGGVTGFLITLKNQSNDQIYISGDTVFFRGVEEVARKSNPKYMFAFTGAVRAGGVVNITMNENDLIECAYAFPSATIIPLHYEGWGHFTIGEREMRDAYGILGITHRLKFLTPGLPVTLSVL